MNTIRYPTDAEAFLSSDSSATSVKASAQDLGLPMALSDGVLAITMPDSSRIFIQGESVTATRGHVRGSRLPRIYVGPGDPTRCARAHRLLDAGKTLQSIATEMMCSRSSAKKWAKAHETMTTYDVTLERADTSVQLGVITTPAGIRAAARAMFRYHRVMLNRLEIPGWSLVVGGRRIDLDTLRDESRREAH